MTGTASITTIVNSTVSDGYIVVHAGADEVARENLWGERRIFHTHIPRQVNVTKEFPAKNADLDIWVVIPSLGHQRSPQDARAEFRAGREPQTHRQHRSEEQAGRLPVQLMEHVILSRRSDVAEARRRAGRSKDPQVLAS